MPHITWLACLAVTAIVVVSAAGQCVPRTFDRSSFVCVCNATYCDEIGLLPTVAPGSFATYTSTIDSERMTLTTGILEPSATGSVGVYVDTDVQFQQIFGFGGAFTDATSINVLKLPVEAQELFFRQYFSPEGSEYNLCRIPIAGTDYSTHAYTYDDVEGDVNLEFWALQPEDYDYKIPAIKKAVSLAQEEILFFGSPWSPPYWMKTNQMHNESGELLPEMYQPYANYFVKFVEAYEAEGVPIWGITPQNEPLEDPNVIWAFNECHWTPEQMRDFVKNNLGPTLEAAGLRRVKMIIHDYNRDILPHFVIPMLEDPDSNKYIDGVGVHWYEDKYAPAENLDKTRDLDPSKFILFTEACEDVHAPPGDPFVHLGSWERGEDYIEDIIENLNHWAVGWTDWNMALSPDGGPRWCPGGNDSPIIVNEETGEFWKQPMYYAFSHLTKVIKRDAYRVTCTVDNTPTLSCAAVTNPDGTIAIVMHSKEETQDLDVSIAIDYQTYLNVNIPARSFKSYIVRVA